MLANFLQTLYNLTDTWFLGRLDAASLSAPTVSMPIIWFLTVFAMGFSIAGTTLISQSKGSGSCNKVNLYLGQMTVLLMVLSVFIGFLGILITRPLLSLMKTPGDVGESASIYMRIIFAGIPFMFLTIVLQAAYRGIGNSMIPLMVQIVSITLNVALDPLLIFGLGPFRPMGVAGAAWATLTARSLAALISLILLFRGFRGLKLSLENIRPRRKEQKLLLKIGLPASLGQAMTALGFAVLQGVINGFGTPVIAAFGIGNRLIGLFNMPAMGFSQATAALVGQALGGRRIDEAKRINRLSQISIFIFLMVSMSLTFFWGNRFTGFFVKDPEVVIYGAKLFRIVSASVVFFGMFMVYGGVFQGSGYTKAFMALNIIRLWGLRLPMAWILGYPAGLGPEGIWWSMFISNIIVFSAALAIYQRGKWITALNPDEI